MKKILLALAICTLFITTILAAPSKNSNKQRVVFYLNKSDLDSFLIDLQKSATNNDVNREGLITVRVSNDKVANNIMFGLNRGLIASRSRSGVISLIKGSKNVVGYGFPHSTNYHTNFTTQLSVGDFLYTRDGVLIGNVASIEDDTHLTLTNNSPVEGGYTYFSIPAE